VVSLRGEQEGKSAKHCHECVSSFSSTFHVEHSNHVRTTRRGTSRFKVLGVARVVIVLVAMLLGDFVAPPPPRKTHGTSSLSIPQ